MKYIRTVEKSLVENWLEIAADNMQKEIDFEILLTTLIEMGWTKIALPYFDSRYHSIDVREWANKHCGKFHHRSEEHTSELQSH